MFYQPELIAYLWLLPVTFFVAIPAAMATCRFLIGCMKESPAEVEEQEIILEQPVMVKA